MGPIGAIWLRLIMSLVYNAFQCYKLSRTVNYLLSDECTSFKDYQRKKARLPPFRQFCKVLAKNLTNVDYVHEFDNSDDSDLDANADQNDNMTIKYNKREAYFTMPELIAKRHNARLGHHESSLEQQSSCVWCCRVNHDAEMAHSRHGRKTKWQCSICLVPLCKVPRYNGQSCFNMFHEAEVLFNPCAQQGAEITTRGHSNRANPPIRTRQEANSDSDEEDQQHRITRRQINQLSTHSLRRTTR